MHHAHNVATVFVNVSIVFFVILIGLYLYAVIQSNKRLSRWPHFKTVSFLLGSAIVVSGLLLTKSTTATFTTHMIVHLCLGMLGPLLIVMATPVRLLLRALPTRQARQMTAYLKSGFVRYITNPFVTTTFHIGGLWLLYTTTLYTMMHMHWQLYFIVHVHMFIAGYLFVQSIVRLDVKVHEQSFRTLAVILIAAMFGHSLLAKYLYMHPPIGVIAEDAQLASQVMYYSGDIVDAVIITLLCMQWYRAQGKVYLEN